MCAGNVAGSVGEEINSLMHKIFFSSVEEAIKNIADATKQLSYGKPQAIKVLGMR